MPSLTLEQAVAAMKSILSELAKPDISLTLRAARKEAAGNMNEIMTKVVPIFFEVQGHVMEPLGFVADDDGFADFADELKAHESSPEFAPLAAELKAIMKKMTTPPTSGDSEEDEEEEEDAGAEEKEEEETEEAA